MKNPLTVFTHRNGGVVLNRDNVVFSRFHYCKPSVVEMDETGYQHSHEKCDVFAYGASGFGTSFYDQVCDCPCHLHNQKMIDEHIENQIDAMREGF